MISKQTFIHCFLGLAIGDALGAPHEGGLVEQLVWRLIGTKEGKKRYTDDTQMALDVAYSFLKNGEINQDHLASTFANNYHWSRGYGPSAAKLLRDVKQGQPWYELNRKKFKEGSLGNGAAMRAPILALCYPEETQQLTIAIKQSAEITHAHPQAIEGAQIIGLATNLALKNTSNDLIFERLLDNISDAVFCEKIHYCQRLTNSQAPPKEILKLGNGILATESCVTALYFSLHYRDKPLMEMLSAIYQLGGDTDTIGAMAGAIWGAFHHDDDLHSLELVKIATQVENSQYIKETAEQLHQHYTHHKHHGDKT